MNEPVYDLLIRLSSVLHFFHMYEESKRLVRLSLWLQKLEHIPENI